MQFAVLLETWVLKMRNKTIHILTPPSSPVGFDWRSDAFAPIVAKFANYMSQAGWKCIVYGVEGSDVECELIICNQKDANGLEYISNAIKEVGKRKKEGDFIASFYGVFHSAVTQIHNDLIDVEPSIGYTAAHSFATYKVFTSYAQLNLYTGYIKKWNKPDPKSRVNNNTEDFFP